MTNGVNFFGPYDAKDSIGRVATLNIKCLESAGIPYELFLLPRPLHGRIEEYAVLNDQLMSSLKNKINIFYFNARRVPLYFAKLNKKSLKDFYNIGFWVHEMQTIPSLWSKQMSHFNEIWTPSSFCQNAISLSANIPVLKFPYPIEKNKISPRILARLAELTIPEFNFLTIFDIESDAERKNPLFTIRAFLEAHKGNNSVRLILKTRNLNSDKLLAEKLYMLVKQYSNIEIIDGHITNSQLKELYEKTDVYVSLHRAEGYGLTIAEAMSQGIPVMTTAYSGNMEFCNSSDTRTVLYELHEIGHNRPRFRNIDIWAEPDMQDTIQAFKELVTNHSAWIKKSLNAKTRIEKEFSIERIGKQMGERLELIGRNFSFADDMSDRQIDFDFEISNTYGF